MNFEIGFTFSNRYFKRSVFVNLRFLSFIATVRVFCVHEFAYCLFNGVFFSFICIATRFVNKDEYENDNNLHRCRRRARNASHWDLTGCRFQDVDLRRQTAPTWSRRGAVGSVDSTSSQADRRHRSAIGPNPIQFNRRRFRISHVLK